MSVMGFPRMKGDVLSWACLTASHVRRMAERGNTFTQHISKDVPVFLFSFDVFLFSYYKLTII